MYILDTDILIYFLKGHEPIVERLTLTPPENITTTIINYTELLFGAFNSTKKKQNLEIVTAFLQEIKILPFDESAAYCFAEHKASFKKDGNLIADLDLMIASIALSKNYTLVSNNIKHFNRVKKLKIENWYN